MKNQLFLPMVLLCATNTGAKQQPKRQDVPVIIIMADQLKYDLPGSLIPNIRKIRDDGVAFTRTYCAAPLCVPSRGSFFTGLYPNHTGSFINGWGEEDEHYSKVKSGTPNLYETMSKRWDSHHVGKQHFFTADQIDKDPHSKTTWLTDADYKKWLKERKIPAPGGKIFKANAPELISGSNTSLKSYSIPSFKEYAPGLENFTDHYYAENAIQVIAHSDPKKPLLLNTMFLAPHPPYSIPEPYFSKVEPTDFTLPDNVGVWYKGQSPLQMYSLTGFLGTRYSRQQWAEIWPKYLGLVCLLDDEVGRIIDALKKQGIYDQAMIIFTADHGEMLGSHSLWQKMCMYEESVHVLMIIKFPKSYTPKVKQCDIPVSLIDVWPTLIDFLDIKEAAPTDGTSLMPAVRGESTGRGPVFIQYDGNGSYGSNQRCILTGNFKLFIDTFKDELFYELYDLTKDPMETDNLAFKPESAPKVKELFQLLKKHMNDTGDLLKFSDNSYEHFLKNYPQTKAESKE